MKPKQKTISAHFKGGENDLVFWSFRYFLGRTTASACTFAESLAVVWPRLDEATRGLIQLQLDEEFIRDDAARNNVEREYGSFPLGHTCDRAAWQKVRNAYSGQRVPRPDKTP